MIAIDTSTLIAYLEGAPGPDVELVEQAFADQIGALPPVVLTEALSDPRLDAKVRQLLLELPVLPVTEGYWERAGALRAKVLGAASRAKLADTLIAQSCLDHEAALVARDRDFAAFSRLAGLRLLP